MGSIEIFRKSNLNEREIVLLAPITNTSITNGAHDWLLWIMNKYLDS